MIRLSVTVAAAACGALLACTARREADAPYKLALPLGLEDLPVQIPADNPLTVKKVALGQLLYFDPVLSADQTVACASCHSPRFGFTDGRPFSTGMRGQKGGRSAPTTLNRVFSTAQFWDGRAASLEEQAKGPIANPIEMGMTHDLAATRIRGIAAYRLQFRAVFGTEDITIDHIARAIAAYERTLLSGNSPYDRFQAGDTSALTPGTRRGQLLFDGKARCSVCHTGSNFTDERFHNLGVGMDKARPDFGRFDVTHREEDRGAFKTPTVRDIALSGPYFHDGSAPTLMDVIEHYDRGGIPNPWLSPRMKRLGLSTQEKNDLAEFLHALTGEIPLQALAPPLPR